MGVPSSPPLPGRRFRSGVTPILVATDIAARGLDVPDIRFVLQYDVSTARRGAPVPPPPAACGHVPLVL